MLQTISGIIEQALKQMDALKEDKDEKETRKILEDKRQELLEQAKLVLPDDKFFEEDLKDEESIVKELAKIQVKLELHAYKNRDQIDGLRKQVEEIKAQDKTEKNREELLQKIKKLETKYKVFGRYIKEEDWEKLYRTKFDVLMCDINQRTESPLATYVLKLDKMDERELESYRKYIQEKIDNILLGKNKEVERVFLGEQITDERNKAVKLGAATELIKRIIKIQSGFDLNSILKDRDLLSLILAFDKERGIEEMTVTGRKIISEQRPISWADLVPLKTLAILSLENYQKNTFGRNWRQPVRIQGASNNYSDFCFYGDIKDTPWYDLIKLSIIDLDKYRKLSNNEQIIPEGVKIIATNAFKAANLKKVTIPSSTIEIEEEAFENSDLAEIVFSEGLKKIGKRAFVNTHLKEVTIPSTVEELGDGSFGMTPLQKISLQEGLRRIGEYAFSRTDLEEITIPSTVEELGEGALSVFYLDNVNIYKYDGKLRGDIRPCNDGYDIAFYNEKKDVPYLIINVNDIKDEYDKNGWEYFSALDKYYGKSDYLRSSIALRNIYETRMEELAKTDKNIKKIYEEYKKQKAKYGAEHGKETQEEDKQDER